MPVVYLCQSCGLVLAVERGIKHNPEKYGITPPQEIISRLIECPKCRSQLAEPKVEAIKITAIPEKKR